MPIFFIIFFSCPLQSTRKMHLMQTFGCMEGLAVGRGDPSIEGQIHKIKLQYQNWRAPLHQDKSTASKSTFFMSSSNTRKLILSHPFQLSQSTVDIPIKYSDTACTNIMYYFKKINQWHARPPPPAPPMANAIKNFHFHFLNPSVMFNALLNCFQSWQ